MTGTCMQPHIGVCRAALNFETFAAAHDPTAKKVLFANCMQRRPTSMKRDFANAPFHSSVKAGVSLRKQYVGVVMCL